MKLGACCRYLAARFCQRFRRHGPLAASMLVWFFIAVSQSMAEQFHSAGIGGPMVGEPVTPRVQEKSPQGRPATEPWKPGDPVRVIPDLRLSLEGEHTTSGTVSRVETETEMVSIETERGTFTVYLPGAAKNLKPGEKITLFVGYAKGSM
jgi:hypothetical protein